MYLRGFNFSHTMFLLLDHQYTVILQVINLILLYSPVKICSLTAERSKITRNGFPKTEAVLLVDINQDKDFMPQYCSQSVSKCSTNVTKEPLLVKYRSQMSCQMNTITCSNESYHQMLQRGISQRRAIMSGRSQKLSGGGPSVLFQILAFLQAEQILASSQYMHNTII